MTDINHAPQGLSRRHRCRLCDSDQLDLAVPMKPTPLGDHYVTESDKEVPQALYPLDLYLCRSCGHVQNLDVVDPDLLFRHYHYVTSSSASLIAHFEAYVGEVLDRTQCRPGSLVVDIGSNDGSLLSMFKSAGFKVLGVDAAVNVAAIATNRGIQTLPEYFTAEVAASIVRVHGHAELVTANNVFAHADRLDELVRGVVALLSDTGCFVFEVSYLVDVIDRFLFDTVYHEHVSYHSVGPLRQFLARYGLCLVNVQRIATKGGSIRCFARKVGYAQPSSIVNELAQSESVRGFGDLALYAKYSVDIADRRKALHAVLLQARAQGGLIAGFGASITVTTLVYNLELVGLIDFIVDDNPSKHGLFSPGAHIPVLAPSALLDRKPMLTVILAWNYADPIIRKHGAYLDQGGCFVVPLPELRKISTQ